MSRNRINVFWVALATLLAATALAAAMEARAQSTATATAPAESRQATPEDYAHAAKFDRGPLLIKLKNGLVIPHWIGTSDDFWYKNGSLISYDFMVVQASTGEKKPAFDRTTMAKALGDASGEKISAERLPFDSFTFTDKRDAIRFVYKFEEYQC